MPQQAASPMDPDRQDSRRAMPAGAGLVALSGASRGAARMAVSKGRLKLDVPSVPSLVPSLFPLWLNEILAFPVFWISGYHPYGRSGLVMAISSTTRNTGNIRNRIEASRVGHGTHVEQAWNTGNRLSGGRDAAL